MSNIRKQLIDKCDVLIEDLQKASLQFNLGKAQQAVTAAMSTTSGVVGTASTAPRTLEITVGQSVPELCQLTHAILVQEWHIFLDSIFQEAVLHYLKKKDTRRFPEQIELELESLNLKDINALRKSISEAAAISFSFKRYGDRIDKLCKLLEVSPDNNFNKFKVEMKKHILIRNCFQHNRGLVRPLDLPKCGFFELTNDKGNKVKYQQGDRLALSETDVIGLNQIIKDFSKEFEVVL